jgi:hypothetical protein
MKKILFLLLAVLALAFISCEKEQITSPAFLSEDSGIQALESAVSPSASVESRSVENAVKLIDQLITRITLMHDAGKIENEPARRIVKKLVNIKEELIDGETNVALSKLTELITLLEEFAANGTEGISSALIAAVEVIRCEVDEDCTNRTDLWDNGCYNHSDPMVWEFDWADVPGATQYQLYVKNEGATYPALNNVVVYNSEYTEISYSYTIAYTGWYWQVRALVDGAWTEYSEKTYFEVEPINTDCP